MKSEIKVSICIPTLNRGRFIADTLESVVSQVTDEVEIVIVDGGSQDNTAEAVEIFKQRCSSVRYFHSGEQSNSGTAIPSCKGFDRDCNRAVELARGEYCWLFTDDDLLKPGAIKAVLEASARKYGSIIVNAEVRSQDLADMLEPARLRFSSDRVYLPSECGRFFAEVGNYLSFVGGLVIRKDLWLARQKEPYFGTGLIHIGVLFQRPLSEPVLVMAEPWISIRYGNALYARSPRHFEIQSFLWPRLIWSFESYSDSAKNQVCRKEPWRRFRTLLFFRAIGAFSKGEYDRWLKGRLDGRWKRFLARAAASFPARVANLLAFMYFHISGRLPGQFLVDLVKSPYYFARPFRRLRTEWSANPNVKKVISTRTDA